MDNFGEEINNATNVKFQILHHWIRHGDYEEQRPHREKSVEGNLPCSRGRHS
jgi:hypothetical protein